MFLVRGRSLGPDGERYLLITFEDVTAPKQAERLLNTERELLAREVESTAIELERSREELRALAASLLRAQEEERRRIARELHDDISQKLASISIDSDVAIQALLDDPAGAKQKLKEILAHLSELGQDVRTLSHRLHPSIIEDLGLRPALRSLTEEFGEREGMIATFFSDGLPPDLPLDIATGLYRIAQEALRNVAKHAGETHVKMQLAGAPGCVELEVADSGLGFDMGKKSTGLGLISMKERARLIGGTVEIWSAFREGTKVTVRVPIPEVA